MSRVQFNPTLEHEPSFTTAAITTTGAQCTLSSVLVEMIESYAGNKNDKLNAALYEYLQDGCFLKVIFSRHRMDTRGKLVASLAQLTYRNVLGQDYEPEANPQWHVDSRAELAAILDTMDPTFDAFYLVFWEGVQYRPPFHVRFPQKFKAKACAAIRAKGEFERKFEETPIAFTIPIVEPTARADVADSDAEKRTWVDEAADKIYLFVGKMEPNNK